MQGALSLEQQDSQMLPATPPQLRCLPQDSPLHVTSPSAFARSPSQRLPPVHLSTIGRSQLVDWINQELNLSLKDISQCNNGAVACQMCDRLNPSTKPINMRKVDFNANSAYYKEKNWKLLQHAFNILQTNYNVDVEKCQNGNQLPLLMIFRFLKQRFDQWTEELAANGQKIPSYDAVARRAISKTGDIKDSAPGIPTLRPFSGGQQSRKSESAVKDGDSAMESHCIDRNTEAIAIDKDAADIHTSESSSDSPEAIARPGKPSVWRKLKRALSNK